MTPQKKHTLALGFASLLCLLSTSETLHAEVSGVKTKAAQLSNTASNTKILEQHWRVVLFDGQKVGHAFAERKRENGEYVNREVMDLDIKRGASQVKLYTEQAFVENENQQPTGFVTRILMSSAETLIKGKIDAARTMQITQTVGGMTQTSSQPLPADVLFPEAQIALLKTQGFKPGAVVKFRALDPSSMEIMQIITKFIARKPVDLVTETRELFEVKQSLSYPQATIEAQAFVDDDFVPLKTRVDMMGITLEITEATKKMALAPNQSVDELQRLMLTSPRALTKSELDSGLRYTLKHVGEGEIDGTDEQRVTQNAAGFIVDVCARCGAPELLSSAELMPFLQATSYLQSDALAMQKAAVGALTKLSKTARADHRQAMQTLEIYVRNLIVDKNLDVGYASALEVLQNPSGDCTEHAVLLAALGRAAGVPTRVAGGFAYAPEYLGQKRTFVPHAWVQAYIDGRWHSFDAALDGFNAGHITIETGNGDPSRFYGSVHLLGNLEITAVRALTAAELK